MKGKIIDIDSFRGNIAFSFSYEASTYDFETIWKTGLHQKTQINQKAQPINREILYNNTLTLYLKNLDDWLEYFSNPYYSITFGRSQDLATIRSITKIQAVERENGLVSNSWFPLEMIEEFTPAVNFRIYRVPYWITPSIPRVLSESKMRAFTHAEIYYPRKGEVDPETNRLLVWT